MEDLLKRRGREGGGGVKGGRGQGMGINLGGDIIQLLDKGPTLDIISFTNRIYKRGEDESRLLLSMELRSASIWYFPKYEKR